MLTLIELVLRLQRPEKTSRTSSKPPSTDRKERRERSKPGGAKPGHEGHSRVVSEAPDDVVAHRPDRCSGCGTTLSAALPADVVSVHERIDLPEVVPVVIQHRRLAVRCPCCGLRVRPSSRRRSTWPLTFVMQASTTPPQRFSISAWTSKANLASMLALLR